MDGFGVGWEGLATLRHPIHPMRQDFLWILNRFVAQQPARPWQRAQEGCCGQAGSGKSGGGRAKKGRKNFPEKRRVSARFRVI